MLTQSDLPEAWCLSEGDALDGLRAEYERELPTVLPLANVPVRLVAHRNGTDDILLQHQNPDGLFSVVHLTWLMKSELPNFPCVEFTGT
jgi:hypothetical protein